MLIELIDVSKKIKANYVLSHINLKLESGHIYGFLGPNGCGKTMLLRTIVGLVVPTNGHIVVNGKKLHKDLSFPENTGILIEKPEFLTYLSGFQNLKLLAKIKGIVSDKEIKQFMLQFNLSPDSSKKVSQYSLGMKQKLGLIQAFMENQQFIVLDEPFNALDEETAQYVKKLLLEYKKEGRLIIITSHHKEDIDSLCDITYKISNGKIIQN